MRRFRFILSVLTLSAISYGQSKKDYIFKEIGFHIKLPDSYLIQNAFPKATYDIQKELLTVSLPDSNNTVSFKLAKQTRQTFSFEQCYNTFRNFQLLIGKQHGTEFDTLSSTLNVGHIIIRKFLTYSTISKPAFYSGVYIAAVKRHFLIIQLDYIDKKFGDDIEKAIVASKFD